MVSIHFSDENLILTIEGADKLWSLKSKIVIPLQHIVSARLDPSIVREWFHGLRAPGTNIPGVITAGTFYQDGNRVFWDVHHPELALLIELHDEPYNELVVEVDNPQTELDRISRVLGM